MLYRIVDIAVKIIIMDTQTDEITEKIYSEVQMTPRRYRSLLLRIVHSFREGIEAEPLSSAEESFRESWRDIQAGRVYPIEDLWAEIESEENGAN